MTKSELARRLAWRFKVIQQASERSRNVARTCQFGVASAIDFAHAARAERAQNLVGPSRVPAERAMRGFVLRDPLIVVSRPLASEAEPGETPLTWISTR
jgi:hypothetical protein